MYTRADGYGMRGSGKKQGKEKQFGKRGILPIGSPSSPNSASQLQDCCRMAVTSSNTQGKLMTHNKGVTLLAFSLDTRLSAGCEMVAHRMPAK